MIAEVRAVLLFKYQQTNDRFALLT